MVAKKNKIFLITTSFPNGDKEPLIINELPFLKSKFDEVEIITYTSGKTELNLKEIIHEYNINISGIQKLIGLFLISWVRIFSELNYVKYKYKLTITPSILKVAIMAAIRGGKFQRYIEKRFKYDIKNKNITFYSWWSTEEVIGLANLKRKNKNIKVYSRMHAYDLYFERHLPPYLPFRPYIFQQLDNVFVISYQGFNYIQDKLGIQLNNLAVSKLGVNNNYQLQTLKEQKTLRIVSCSTLIPIKRVQLIIGSLSKLNPKLNIEWNHFGDGPEMNKLKIMSNNKLALMSNITTNFHGKIDNIELHSFYQQEQIDLFINVSETEGVPISIMEAMSYGIPCIGTNVGGVSELINHKKNGYLLPVDFELEYLTSLIEKVNSLPFVTRIEMQQNAYSMWNNNYNSDKNNISLIQAMLKASI